jgi:hypothetical protein
MKRKFSENGNGSTGCIIRSKTKRTTRRIGESHANFYPVGAIIQWCLLASQPALSSEIFEIDTTFNVILDYLGPYRPFVVWLEDDEHKSDKAGHILSTHPTEALAIRAAFVEFCDSDLSLWSEMIADGYKGESPRPHHRDEWEQYEGQSPLPFAPLCDFMSRIVSVITSDFGRFDTVKRLIASWHSNGSLSDKAIGDLWKLCVKWQKTDFRRCVVKELRFGSDPDASKVADTESDSK